MDDVVALPIGWANVVAAFIPLLVALGTKYRLSTSRPQAFMAIGLSSLVAVLQMLTDDVPNDTVQSVVAAFLSVFVTAVAAYVGVWKPVTDVNTRLAPNKGI